MKENLFRGKFVGTGEWVYGSLLTDIYGSYPCILRNASLDDDSELHFDFTPVEPTTISQCTGLKDKNGTKIFEGDIILEEHMWYPSSFCWDNPRFAIPVKTYFYFEWYVDRYRPHYIYQIKKGDTPSHRFNLELFNSDFGDWYDSDCLGDNSVVCGNIYDNAEFVAQCDMMDKAGYEEGGRSSLGIKINPPQP